jgi:hypothetical protein
MSDQAAARANTGGPGGGGPEHGARQAVPREPAPRAVGQARCKLIQAESQERARRSDGKGLVAALELQQSKQLRTWTSCASQSAR